MALKQFVLLLVVLFPTVVWGYVEYTRYTILFTIGIPKSNVKVVQSPDGYQGIAVLGNAELRGKNYTGKNSFVLPKQRESFFGRTGYSEFFVLRGHYNGDKCLYCLGNRLFYIIGVQTEQVHFWRSNFMYGLYTTLIIIGLVTFWLKKKYAHH